MKYKVTLNGRTYEVEVEHGKAILLDEYEAIAPAPVAGDNGSSGCCSGSGCGCSSNRSSGDGCGSDCLVLVQQDSLAVLDLDLISTAVQSNLILIGRAHV